MSLEEGATEIGDAGATADISMTDAKTTYKSWKKKYRKMKVSFDQKMKDSEQLFRDEQKAQNTLRRLAEENHKLLDLLLDVNDSIHIPHHHRFDLISITTNPPSSSAVPALEPDQSPHADDPPAVKSFSKLLSSVAHSNLADIADEDLPLEIRASPPPASYITPAHEEEFLLRLDSNYPLEGFDSNSDYPSSGAHKLSGATADREKDKDVALRNPVSVYNWLRKHQPQVFLQDNEGPPEKSGAKSSRGAGRRSGGVVKSVTNTDLEIIEDDNMVHMIAEHPGQGRISKKKKEDDAGYRPKGGGSKLGKRKREGEDKASSAKKARKSHS
ncbi:MAG: hypothetical protein M1825_002425 [Sarcosagium campestre]|nr:MAG: hypothetical protein M1825_002425 [Sarcosagium campestre]